MIRIGIDLGGTKTEGIVIDRAGRELARRRVATGFICFIDAGSGMQANNAGLGGSASGASFMNLIVCSVVLPIRRL